MIFQEKVATIKDVSDYKRFIVNSKFRQALLIKHKKKNRIIHSIIKPKNLILKKDYILNKTIGTKILYSDIVSLCSVETC